MVISIDVIFYVRIMMKQSIVTHMSTFEVETSTNKVIQVQIEPSLASNE